MLLGLHPACDLYHHSFLILKAYMHRVYMHTYVNDTHVNGTVDNEFLIYTGGKYVQYLLKGTSDESLQDLNVHHSLNLEIPPTVWSYWGGLQSTDSEAGRRLPWTEHCDSQGTCRRLPQDREVVF